MAQVAWADGINYIYYTIDAQTHEVTTNTGIKETTEYSVLESTTDVTGSTFTEFDGWWVVKEPVVFNKRIIVKHDTKIILCDYMTLTANQGIFIKEGATLTIYAQSTNESVMGTLVARTTENDKAAIGGEKNTMAGRLFIQQQRHCC